MVVAAAPGLDQDQLVVALVAGQVGDAPAALGLDQAEDIGLEGDGGVEVPALRLRGRVSSASC